MKSLTLAHSAKSTICHQLHAAAGVPNAYGGLSNAAYVSALLGRYQLTQITTIDPQQPDGTQKLTYTAADLTNQLNGNTLTRAQVLRAITDSDQVTAAEFNNVFVAMQY